LRQIIHTAFGIEETVAKVDWVYPKKTIPIQDTIKNTDQWLIGGSSSEANSIDASHNLIEILALEKNFEEKADAIFKTNGDCDDGADDGADDGDGESIRDPLNIVEEADILAKAHWQQTFNSITDTQKKIPYKIVSSSTMPRQEKINKLNESLMIMFPQLCGDIVTFIGSTFMTYGEDTPYKDTCVVLNTCDRECIPNAEIFECKTEKEVLLEWKDLVKREDPDIIIGYHIFGFDYNFMFIRAQENKCEVEFLKLSRNEGEICGRKDRQTGEYSIAQSTTKVASGTHLINIIEINGRLQVDLLPYYRKTSNYASYKLDAVLGYNIGDTIKSVKHVGISNPNPKDDTDGIIKRYVQGDTIDSETQIKTKNMVGLIQGSYIRIEEIRHSSDYYLDGAKLIVDF
jgi:hypothetical protein